MIVEKDKPAFGFGTDSYAYEGLTKREYFTGLAMQGLLQDGSDRLPKNIIKDAIELADELLKQLEENK